MAAVLTQAADERQCPPMTGLRVRRAKAALPSGCKPHPAKCSSRKQPENGMDASHPLSTEHEFPTAVVGK